VREIRLLGLMRRGLETLVLYRKRASAKEAYQNTVVQRAFDKAV